MNQDPHRAFVDDGIELFLLGGGSVRGKIVKGEDLAIIFSELSFCSGEDELYLFIGVVVVVVVGDVVLEEVSELLEFLAVIGSLRREDPVFPFWRFLEVIVNALLSGNCPDQQQKYHR
jgi:hypothetical protein